MQLKTSIWKNGEAPPEERREGGAKPPKTSTQFCHKKRRERCDRVRESVEEKRERGDRTNYKVM